MARRAELEPQLSPYFAASHSPERPRSRSEKILDALPASISDAIKARRTSNIKSSESIAAGLVQAGLSPGSIGASYVINHSQEIQIRNGAAAFLDELENVVSIKRAQTIYSHDPVGLEAIKGTIQVQDDAVSVHGIHPITDVDENPFDVFPEPISPVESVNLDDLFVEDILIPHGTDKLFMRARLDTGMESNAISLDKALETGFDIQPYLGPELVVGDGQTFQPLGQLELLFYFSKLHSAKTWTVRFLVFPDPPFDIAFGRTFIYKAKLFTRNPEALPVEFRKYSKEEEARKKRDTADSKRESDRKQAERDSKYGDRRNKPPPYDDRKGSRR